MHRAEARRVWAAGFLWVLAFGAGATGGSAPSDRPGPRPYKSPPDASAGTLPAGIGVPVGERAPDATLRDSEGRAVRILDLTKAGRVLVVAHRAYRVVHKVGEAEYARLKGFGMDLERASGRAHHSIAVPSLFLVDTEGVVRWAHADPDYKVRPSTAQVLAAIDGAGLPRP